MNTGIVIKAAGSWYYVQDNNGFKFQCSIKGKLRLKGVKTTNIITVGDIVDFEADEKGVGVISLVHERKNYIIRKASNLSRESHIIAANIDQTMLIVTVEFPETSLGFIDRYLVTAEAYRIPVVLVFNKIDLFKDKFSEKLNNYISIYENIGYKCLKVSAKTNENIDQLKEILHNKISLFSGNSGVGKSHLINKVELGLNLKTEQISLYHLKGKHTTTFSEMFSLQGGGYIIDTPGIKGFGLIDIDKNELYHFFPEFFNLSKNCRFYNCTHIHEPGCAIINAFESGAISESRYASYVNIYNDENQKYRT